MKVPNKEDTDHGLFKSKIVCVHTINRFISGFYCLFLSVRLEILFSPGSSEEPIFTASRCNIYFSSFYRNITEVIFLGICEYFINCRSALYYYSDILNTDDDDVDFSGRYYALTVAPGTIPARLTAPEVFSDAASKT